MTDKPARQTRRPRLDAGARERLLAEIARLERNPADKAADDARAALNTPEPAAPEPQPQPQPRPEPAVAPEPAPAPAQAVSAVEQDPPAPVDPMPAAPQSPGPMAETASPSGHDDDQNAWPLLRQIPLDGDHLERNLVITANRSDPAHGAFDVLRTRLVQALADKGWTRVAITSPTAGCGKSFTAMNLAITLSRYDRCRTVLMDMDMRRPSLSRYLGIRDVGPMGDYLRGLRSLEDHFVRPGRNTLHIGENLAVGLNDRPEAYAAELFQEPETELVLDDLHDRLSPEVVLYDLPPALAQDDVIAFRPHFDCVLMVVGGGITTAEDVREATRRIGEDKPVLGVVLNKADVQGDYDY